MQPFDQVRYDAFARLLAQPDPSDLPRRVSFARCEGDPNQPVRCLPVLTASLEGRSRDVKLRDLPAAESRSAHWLDVDPVPGVLANGAIY